MAHDLPAPVRLWLADQVKGRRLAALKDEHTGVSAHYRAGGPSSGVIDSDAAILSYALARMPATFAATGAALARLGDHAPDFAPKSALDIGCGPGTALIAALEAFPGLETVTGVDHNAPFLAFARRMIDATGHAAGRTVTLTGGDLAKPWQADPADLVLSSYALVELAEAAALTAIRHAWALTRGALVLIEPGSRAGFSRIRTARAALLAEGARLLAPCPHHAPCPMVEPDWCHFSIRLARSREHRLIKGGDAPFEDEKFSYLIAARTAPAVPAADRIIAPPRRSKPALDLTLCTGDGTIRHRTFALRETGTKAIRKCDWGDALPRPRNS